LSSDHPFLLEFVQLDTGLDPPGRAHTSDAGLDLRARSDTTISRSTGPRSVSTGVCIAVPVGYVGLICPRSGLAAQSGISVLNAPGIVDAGFSGEIVVVLFGTQAQTYEVKRGDRIAQLVIVATPAFEATRVDSFEKSARGVDGLGSTGR